MRAGDGGGGADPGQACVYNLSVDPDHFYRGGRLMPAEIKGTDVLFEDRGDVWEAIRVIEEGIDDLRLEHLELQNLVQQMIDVFGDLIRGKDGIDKGD